MFMGIVFIWFMYIQYLECSVCMILPLYNFMGFDSLDLTIYGVLFTDICTLCGIRALQRNVWFT